MDSSEFFLAHPRLAHFASEALRGDRAFVAQLIPMRSDAWHFASAALKRDAELALLALRACDYRRHIARRIPSSLRGNRDVMLLIVLRHGDDLRRCARSLRQDVDFVRQAVERSPHAICYAAGAEVIRAVADRVGMSQTKLRRLLRSPVFERVTSHCARSGEGRSRSASPAPTRYSETDSYDGASSHNGW